MQILDDRVVYSPTDLISAAACQFATLRALDATLGWAPPPLVAPDPLMERAARLGDAHEARVLAAFEDQFGVARPGRPGGVVRIERGRGTQGYTEARNETLRALQSGADVVYQATFFADRFVGLADFLIRDASAYRVADAKLARRVKVQAVLQIAAYAHQWRQAGIETSDEGVLILGDGSWSRHDVGRVIPVYLERQARFEELVDRHRAGATPVRWGDGRVLACGRCATCELEVQAHRDLLLVAGMRVTQRARLRESGITTIDELAAHEVDVVPGVPARSLATLTAQARLQVAQESDGQIRHEVVDATGLALLPPPSEGDTFFDFEGDPMWQGAGSEKHGLEYLFGVLEPPPGRSADRFTPLWAHDRAEERQALVDFLALVRQRRERWPDLHIYHYANYEKAALLRLAARHGVGENDVDDLLRQQVLVDLYPIVKGAIRVSRPSYGLKELEPLFMGDKARQGRVTAAADSVLDYAEYCAANEQGALTLADEKLRAIADYNRYDCEATMRLRDWLLALAADASVAPIRAALPSDGDGIEGEATGGDVEEAWLAPLWAFADRSEPGERTAEQTAVALIAAAVGFHKREDKPMWWAYYDRLAKPVDEWVQERDTMLIEDVRVATEWQRLGRQRTERRVLHVVGQLQPGSELERARDILLLYEDPIPEGADAPVLGGRGLTKGECLEVLDIDAEGRVTVSVTEKAPKGAQHACRPMALAPLAHVSTPCQQRALHDLAQQTLHSLEASALHLPRPLDRLLLRQPPRLKSGPSLPPVIDGDYVSAVTRAVKDLDESVLAVQGPPGTGKTFVAARVIANLVDDGWRVGVVAQGHDVVNHLLDCVANAGVDPSRIGKKKKPARSRWTDVKEAHYWKFLADHDDGCVVGGTAWDFTHPDRVRRGLLDLLVVDEAGQFSLADTLAVSVAAQRMLLLGDPQQLPQVSHGTHPAPVDESALGWLSEGRTLPPELGYFLECTWRMHPHLTAAVSRLAYEGRLHAKVPQTTERVMRDGSGRTVSPGLTVRTVVHRARAVSAPEEAQAVLEAVEEALGWSWQGSAEERARPMTPHDILVVAPYNAQVGLIRQVLADAAVSGVRVGTVDRFQGQEAPLVIVSMTASSPEDVPRGMDFLMSTNRLNVAISRAQWRSVVIRSDVLTDYLPATIDGLQDLGGFLGLSGAART